MKRITIKRGGLSFLIIFFMLIFGVAAVSAQEMGKKEGTEGNPKLLLGGGFSFPYLLTKNKLHDQYTLDFLCFFKEEKFYSRLGVSATYFQQEKESDSYVRAFPFVLTGGARLHEFEKAAFFLDGGVGVSTSRQKDYRGAFYLAGIKMLYDRTFCGRGEVNLRYTHYDFAKTAEGVLSVGFVFWGYLPKGKKVKGD